MEHHLYTWVLYFIDLKGKKLKTKKKLDGGIFSQVAGGIMGEFYTRNVIH